MWSVRSKLSDSIIYNRVAFTFIEGNYRFFWNINVSKRSKIGIQREKSNRIVTLFNNLIARVYIVISMHKLYDINYHKSKITQININYRKLFDVIVAIIIELKIWKVIFVIPTKFPNPLKKISNKSGTNENEDFNRCYADDDARARRILEE